MHAATSKTTYTRPGSRAGDGGGAVKRPPPLSALMGAGAAALGAKRKAEEVLEKVELEYFSKEEDAREAAAKGQ